MKKLFLTILLFNLIAVAVSQNQQNLRYPGSYQYGFLLGINYNNLIFKKSNWDYVNPSIHDILNDIDKRNGVGINLGALIEYKINKTMYFRGLPSLMLSHSSLLYEKANGIKEKVYLEFINGELPLHFMIKSQDSETQPYFFFGMGLKYNLAVKDNLPHYKMLANNYAIEFGFGVEKTKDFFNLAPELKYSFGITNLKEDIENIYSESISSLCVHNISLNFIFKS